MISQYAVGVRFPGAGLPGTPHILAPGPDGAMWFADDTGLGRIAPSGAVTEFPLPAGGAQSITAGPDGALWFIGRNSIGRITPAGAIREFSMPAGGEPWGIAAGPDGALWYTEYYGTLLGRITASGTFAQTALPVYGGERAAPYDPRVVVAGPDDALWFTTAATYTLWRVGFTRLPAATPTVAA